MQISKDNNKKFATKLQKMNAMQEGRPMGDGDFYNILEYETMSNEFKTNWLNKYHNGEFSYDDLESDYWKLIKGQTLPTNGQMRGGNEDNKSPQVEYANDLSTLEYSSGFMKRTVRPTLTFLKTCLFSFLYYHLTNIIIYIQDSDAPLGESQYEFGTDEYYRNCGWNLNNISSWPGSPIKYVTHAIDGINKPWVYHGMLFASFCWHREDIYLASINYLHEGADKQWYGVPGAKAKNFKSVLEKQLKLRIKEVPDLEHHITTQISPTWYKPYVHTIVHHHLITI